MSLLSIGGAVPLLPYPPSRCALLQLHARSSKLKFSPPDTHHCRHNDVNNFGDDNVLVLSCYKSIKIICTVRYY